MVVKKFRIELIMISHSIPHLITYLCFTSMSSTWQSSVKSLALTLAHKFYIIKAPLLRPNHITSWHIPGQVSLVTIQMYWCWCMPCLTSQLLLWPQSGPLQLSLLSLSKPQVHKYSCKYRDAIKIMIITGIKRCNRMLICLVERVPE